MQQEDLVWGTEDEMTTQSYAGKELIAGVKISKLNQFKDDGGSFMEIARFKDGNIMDETFSFSVAQINISYIFPNVVKAWHIHFNQEDIWFVPPKDRLLVGLVDLRKDSTTQMREMRFVLGGGEAQLLFIPRGVAHGCANLYDREMQLFYLVNQRFNAECPDEQRLPWDAIVGKDFWQLQNG